MLRIAAEKKLFLFLETFFLGGPSAKRRSRLAEGASPPVTSAANYGQKFVIRLKLPLRLNKSRYLQSDH